MPNTESIPEKWIPVPVDESIRDLSNDPTIKKLAEEAKEFLRRYPLPESFLKKVKASDKESFPS